MRKISLLILAGLFVSTLAPAEEKVKVKVFTGYNVHFRSGSNAYGPHGADPMVEITVKETRDPSILNGTAVRDDSKYGVEAFTEIELSKILNTGQYNYSVVVRKKNGAVLIPRVFVSMKSLTGGDTVEVAGPVLKKGGKDIKSVQPILFFNGGWVKP